VRVFLQRMRLFLFLTLFVFSDLARTSQLAVIVLIHRLGAMDVHPPAGKLKSITASP